MRKIYCIAAAFVLFSFAGCGDGVDLPSLGVETDLNKIILPDNNANLVQVELKDNSVPMEKVGIHSEEDFARIREKKDVEEPWITGYQMLKESSFSQKNTDTYPVEYIVRGAAVTINGATVGENYINAARGASIAYQQALRWKIENDDEYAAKAVENLNKWVQTCVGVTGNSNVSLAAGLYGYEFAIAGQLLREYEGWDPEDFLAFQQWLLKVFYPANKDFLVRHHDTNHLHYWANWGLCNIASTIAIGIVTDRRDIYNEGIEHFQSGVTNGRLRRAIYYDYSPEYNFAQWQESGRDQGHTLMCVGLVGVICQLAWSQGDDFFAYDDNLFLRGCEYAACCNYTEETVPFTTYIWQKHNQWNGISPEEQTVVGGGKWIKRAIWALPYYHYKSIKNVSDENLKYTKIATEYVGVEGGGGYYDPNSGGYDVLGFGTLMFAR